MKLVPIAAAHSAFGATVCTAAPRRRSASASIDTAERATLRITREHGLAAGEVGGRVQAQHVGVAAGRRGVEVGRAPDAAVDVLALADRHRREQPRHRARRLDRLGQPWPPAPRGCRTRPGGRTRGRPRRRAAGRRSGRPSRRPAGAAVERVGGRGSPRSSAARITAPPGAATPSASGANVDAGRQRQRAGAAGGSDRRHREARDRGRPGRARASVPTDAGRRGALPATRCAATIAPAEVPTKCSQSRRSKPVASSMPGEHAHHPGLAEHAAAAEDEHVGSGQHRFEASEGSVHAPGVRDNVRLYDNCRPRMAPSVHASGPCGRRWTCRCATSPSARA